MNKLLAFAAAGALLFTAGSAAAATNLVSNGSFESGTLDWTYSGSGDDVPGHQATIITYNNNNGYPTGAFGEMIPPDNSVSPSPDAVGTHALYFVADHSVETLSQDVFLDVGLYTIGFSVYVPFNGYNNSGNATFTGTIAGVNLANFTVDGSTPGQWVHYAGVANIQTAGVYSTAFTYNSGAAPAGDFVVDRAYIVAGNAVPEPSTWALMILGFGSAGAALRSRRKLIAA
ncbi:PEPxxWA-CTERM sorting domain-containing protein [Phenylobacterium sp.]|uniref:PEPxxWA-CTERM sorting domain-containing protein n=1 Tax=Phenylobacterium sp. TaxID=1871053 RepID=UPI0025E102DD|nr:PEPxxWA-CTERM sorting domain-containing protein [Phenylobacterium sp.]